MLDRGYAGSCIRTSENASYRQLVNKDMKKGRGLRRPRPGVGSEGRSVRLFPHVAVIIIGRGLLGPLGVADRLLLRLVVLEGKFISRFVVPGLLAGSALTRWYGRVDERKRRGGHHAQ